MTGQRGNYGEVKDFDSVSKVNAFSLVGTNDRGGGGKAGFRASHSPSSSPIRSESPERNLCGEEIERKAFSPFPFVYTCAFISTQMSIHIHFSPKRGKKGTTRPTFHLFIFSRGKVRLHAFSSYSTLSPLSHSCPPRSHYHSLIPFFTVLNNSITHFLPIFLHLYKPQRYPAGFSPYKCSNNHIVFSSSGTFHETFTLTQRFSWMEVMKMEKSDVPSGRAEVLCRVCGDKASGKHYGVSSCDGCRGFFKRSIRRNLDYVCKESNSCIVDVTRRNQCQACRFRKCLQVNMKRDAVQHERAPRSTSNSTKPKYLPCYPYYFPFKPTFYSSPFFNPGMLSSSAAAAAAAAAASRMPFEMSKFDLTPSTAPSIPVHPSPSPGEMVRNSRGIVHPGNGAITVEPIGNTNLPVLHSPPSNSSSGSSSHTNSCLNERVRNGVSLSSSIHNSLTTTTNSASAVNTATSSPISDSTGVKEDEVSSSGVELQQAHGFKLDLNLLTLNNESIYESAAKLLFLSVKWARSVPSFLHLPFVDQSQLLEEAWPELFILSAAQWSLPIDEGLLLTGSVVPNSRQETLMVELRFLRDALARIAAIRPDHTELACLKALVLFKPETQNLREPLQVEILQDQTHLMLQEYCVTKQPPNKIRFGKLLLILPSIRRISGKTLEELFFKQTVGDVPIERLLCDMFKAN